MHHVFCRPWCILFNFLFLLSNHLRSGWNISNARPHCEFHIPFQTATLFEEFVWKTLNSCGIENLHVSSNIWKVLYYASFHALLNVHRVCMRTRMHVTHTCLHEFMHECMHSCINESTHECMQAFHAYISAST